MKPVSFVLPETFDPREFLKSPRLSRRWDDARYFVGQILRKTANGEVEQSNSQGVVRLQAKFLKNVMYQSDYSAVIDALLTNGVVERSPYQVGERSFGYMLSPRFAEDRHVRVTATDERLIGRVEQFHREHQAEQQSRFQPVHHCLERLQRMLRIDGGKARDILEGLPPKSNRFDAQGVLIRDIEDRMFRFSLGRYGRVANSITSLKREVREALHVGGKKLGSVDLSCAQPAFIAKLKGQKEKETTKESKDREQGNTRECNYDSNPNPYDSSRESTAEDFRLYRSLVQSGQFYEFMAKELGGRFSRDELKRRVLADVIAKRKANSKGAEYPSIVENKFRELFPAVHCYIRHVNADGWEHANLIRMLQREESSLVIETVAADLTSRFPDVFFITLHDAIFTTPEHLPKVEEAFRREFERTGFPMKLKVEG